MDAIRLFTSCYENTGMLRDIKNAVIPRYFIKRVPEGFIYFDRFYEDHESTLYQSSESAQEKVDELNQEWDSRHD
jgi:hypothetical protein